MSAPRRSNMAIALVVGAIVALAAGGLIIYTSSPFQERCCAQEWRRYQQPGGRYVIVVYRIPQPFSMMPGQASDAPGIVRLLDERGDVKQATRVNMVQDVSEPEWTHERVAIKLIADWSLSE